MSDENARILIAAIAQVDPEEAFQLGDEAAGRRVSALGPDADAQAVQAYGDAAAALRRRLAEERSRDVRTDLEILVGAAELRAADRVPERRDSRYVSVARLVYRGVEGTLDQGNTEATREAALARLRAYAGLEAGIPPIAVQAEAAIRAAMTAEGWVGPPRAQVVRDMEDTATLRDGVAELLATAGVTGAEASLSALAGQLSTYDTFVRNEVLPRAREGFLQPPEEYQRLLRSYGIAAEPRSLAERARRAFVETQAELAQRAPAVAATVGVDGSDYRVVLRALRAQQVEGDALLTLYQDRVRELDAIARREHLVTVPDLPLPIRLATASEGAMMPAPFYSAPPLMGPSPGGGEFVLPLVSAKGSATRLDDFASPAASWWLAAHEGHPGHGMQFAVLATRPFSLARRYFAFNSANVEGWALYSEGLVTPYLPPDGQLAALQARLMRAAHTFLDIELNLGILTEAQARKVLVEDVAVSDAWADVCIRRYTYMLPGQAPAYFYGATEIEAIRADVSASLGKRFEMLAFNDFVLGQGLVPPTVLRKAVLEALTGQAPAP